MQDGYTFTNTVDHALEFVGNHKGRKVGTLISDKAKTLNTVTMKAVDLLIMSPEKTGLSQDVIDVLNVVVYIPHIGHTDDLIVVVSFRIFLTKW